MLGGPKSGLTARTSTPGEATAFAAVPIFAVIEAVVLGLTITMRMRKVPDCVASAATSSCPLWPINSPQRPPRSTKVGRSASNALQIAAQVKMLDALVPHEVGRGA